MACCCPSTRHCLSQGWLRSMSPYGISRPHWVYLLLTVIIPRSPYANLQQWNIQYLSFGPRENDHHLVDDILNVSSWTKFAVFWLKFHWNLFPEVQLPIGQYWFRNCLALIRRLVFIWTIGGLSQWRIYASLGPRVLMCWQVCLRICFKRFITCKNGTTLCVYVYKHTFKPCVYVDA